MNDRPATPRSLPVQVGVFVNDQPATETEARAAFAQLGWFVAGADDTAQGVWLVHTNERFRRTLRRAGHAQVSAGPVDVFAELP